MLTISVSRCLSVGRLVNTQHGVWLSGLMFRSVCFASLVLFWSLNLNKDQASLGKILAKVDWLGIAVFTTGTTLFLVGLTSGRVLDVVNCNRRKALRSIDLVIQLPDYNEDRYGEIEDHEHKHQNNRVFTNDIQHLYRTFEQWQQDDERSGNSHDRDARISLTVRAMSRSDELNMATEARLRRKRSGDLGKIEDIGGARYEASYLRLLAVLPQVSAIRELRLPQRTELLLGKSPEENRFCSPRRISGKTATGMMSFCTSLSRADLELFDDYSKDLAFRQQERKGESLLALFVGS